jgi:hypothetical protein
MTHLKVIVTRKQTARGTDVMKLRGAFFLNFSQIFSPLPPKKYDFKNLINFALAEHFTVRSGSFRCPETLQISGCIMGNITWKCSNFRLWISNSRTERVNCGADILLLSDGESGRALRKGKSLASRLAQLLVLDVGARYDTQMGRVLSHAVKML